ncbi:MAG: helix-turn-helix transcriptional regulator [Erysipelotrichaceae bacterium]|nr:helix-turn-helix transcriptional regulator [Erysipelotrichaceae bacterium]
MKHTETADNNVVYIIVGKNIRKYRKQQGLKQAELAELCHLSEGFISDLESNTFRTISLNTLYLIAKKLNVHIKQLFDDLEEDQSNK